jgi:hypothetical protein
MWDKMCFVFPVHNAKLGMIRTLHLRALNNRLMTLFFICSTAVFVRSGKPNYGMEEKYYYLLLPPPLLLPLRHPRIRHEPILATKCLYIHLLILKTKFLESVVLFSIKENGPRSPASVSPSI